MTATIDGEKYKIDGLDEITKSKLYDYIKENSYGEVNTDGNKIKTKELIIRTLLDKDIPYIYYSSHVKNIGWQRQKNDGEISGTTGKSLRLEAIQIKLVKKSTIFNGPTNRPSIIK